MDVKQEAIKKVKENELNNNLEVLVRAHQVVEKGYEFFNGRRYSMV